MRFDLDDDEAAVLAGVGALLAQRAGPQRARELGGDEPRHDAALEDALAEAGYLDLFDDAALGPVGAAMVTEAVARRAGIVPIGARAIVAPALGVTDCEAPVALVAGDDSQPVRYGTVARTALVLGEDAVRLVPVDPSASTPVRSRYGFPLGHLGPVADGAGTRLDASPDRMRAWWRVALAIEAVGTMVAALDLTVAYVRDRHQFGRPIGSFQGIQHNLSECAVLVNGARWMALEAAWRGAPVEASALAMAHTAQAAERVLSDTHQFTGAIGFTAEYDLHLWTMRLPAMLAEADTLGAPARSATAHRWRTGWAEVTA